MRSRRALPLGSPSRKDRLEGDGSDYTSAALCSAAPANNGNNNTVTDNNKTSKVRNCQAPNSGRHLPFFETDEASSKRTMRRATGRGLPLSRSSSVSSPTPKAPPDIQSESHDDDKKKTRKVTSVTLSAAKEESFLSSKKLKSGNGDPKMVDAALSKKTSAFATRPKKNSLFVVDPRSGSLVELKLVVNKKHYRFTNELTSENSPDLPSDSAKKGPPSSLGKDGNQFNCEMCGEFGDVVCCDGCPKVYHRDCIPLSHPSRESLDNDDNPWFCPLCVEARKNGGSSSGNTSKKARFPRRCPTSQVDAGSSRNTSQHDVEHQCDACGENMDMPYYDETGNTLCSECYAVENETEPSAAADMEAYTENEPAAVSEIKRKRSERKRKPTVSATAGEDQERLPKKKKRKKNKPQTDSLEDASAGAAGSVGSGSGAAAAGTDDPIPGDLSGLPFPLPVQSKTGPFNATPAFYFYLAENRGKIEKALARSNRSFSRIHRGGEKNALIAKEAAIAWSRLPPQDQRRYMNMSMRDFEGRIIEWKEDKNIREMKSGMSDAETSETLAVTESRLQEEDEQLKWKRHQRLYLSTSVGSKPFKAEPDQAYNRVLQDLLHDMRFHPLPMLDANRPEEEEDGKEEGGAKILIPYFDVHGPVSTSVGDACMGCLRSWNHFCPVLQRRVPAVEHRAKLQPPISSLMATRVGLGLRPRLEEKTKSVSAADEGQEKQAPLGVWRESKDREEMINMKILPSCTLTSPNDRMDDIVLFVEETTAMKVLEPSRPSDDNKNLKASTTQLRTLPLTNSKAFTSEESLFKKCGRCRAIIQNDTGCVQCRRAQLVINMAKRQKQDGKLLKVHTSMLGRYSTKEVAEGQRESDASVAAAMLRERWTPSSVLPPRRQYAPNPYRTAECCGDDDDEGSEKANGFGDISAEVATPSKNEPEEQREARSCRKSRAAASAMNHDVFEPHERQEVMEKNRKAVTAFQKKLVGIACCGIFQALARRDPLKLFDQPISDDAYYEVIKQPIFFCHMREKVLSNQYTSLGGFGNDVKQLCDNALDYNLPGSIYAKTASDLLELYNVMHKRATQWVTALKDSYANYLASNQGFQTVGADGEVNEEEALASIRRDWPEAYRLYQSADWLRNHVASDFLRTEENENAYYGSMAVSRVALAAEAALAPYTDMTGPFGVVTRRTEEEDRDLRQRIDNAASSMIGPVDLSTPSTWREESVHRLLRKVQSRRLDRITASEQGCARCDGSDVDQDVKLNMKAEAAVGKSRKSEDADLPRVDGTRIDLTTGRGSANARATIGKRRLETEEEQFDSVAEACVSVRGSTIHGLGLFADQEFKQGDAVAEYVGEYISNEEFEARETIYRENRTQDYSFRISPDLVIDATRRGGPGRYANHDCNPNCASRIIPGKERTPHLKRVMIVALRSIKINEEITYDYQFPLEQDLSARLPCNCRSESCRGFMNWDLPEKGSNNRVVLVQKRGANMRDRIRRLNRPLKRDEM